MNTTIINIKLNIKQQSHRYKIHYSLNFKHIQLNK